MPVDAFLLLFKVGTRSRESFFFSFRASLSLAVELKNSAVPTMKASIQKTLSSSIIFLNLLVLPSSFEGQRKAGLPAKVLRGKERETEGKEEEVESRRERAWCIYSE